MSLLVTPTIRSEQLSNGLQVYLVERRQAPVVATALCYRAGTLDEPPAREGVAHFLEHMMFRGSSEFGEGEIDRLTQALGGSNNADTSHDCTTYYFSFARDRWTTALEIEADRMAGLLFEPAVVEAERAIILEEVKMHQDDPWDALEEQVMAALYGHHAYGRPVLGTVDSLKCVDRMALAEFHSRCYRPENAVLAIAGDVGPEAFEEVERFFAEASGGERPRSRSLGKMGPSSAQRVERHQGEVARLLCAVRAPALGEPEYPAMRLVVAILGTGRASRLNRSLVEEARSCAFVSVEMTETLVAGALLIAAELIPGWRPPKVERMLLNELERVADGFFEEDELARAKSLLIADWVFGHEQAQEMALTIATAGALMDPELPARHLEKIQSCSLLEVQEAAAQYLGAASPKVVGWSLPPNSRS
ncbi:MAG: pitrilysin family protein [Thermoanaerobaculia bacterium]